MIQRIQSLWLFLASMVAGLLFIFPLFHYIEFLGIIPQQKWERVQTYWPLLVLAAALTLLPLITIFFFGNRSRQRGMVWLTILIAIAFLVVMGMHFANLGTNRNPVWAVPGPVLPVAAIIFLFFALRGIRKDDKLIKSLDRLR